MNQKPKSSLVNKLLSPDELNNDENIVHHFSKYVTLVEDTFGMLLNSENQPVLVKRFTWTNHNKISVSVITYGARIVSMKLPDRGANVEEVVLGFDDLAGYLFYEKYRFGATIGRTTTKLNMSTYVADDKQYWLNPNDKEHHAWGGERGLDKVNWVPYVNGKVLQLSYMSPDGDEGYPGDLHVRITFELTTGAEFRISITANTTKVTPVDISNLTYINLGGHQAGEAEIRRHELLINANCHTVMDKDNEFPTRKIMNVVHTRHNFQTPILLGSVMREGPESAYDQNFCINRGVHQGDAFIARLVHPYKGRVVEIYSNQHGVNFSNGADFPCGRYNIPTDILDLFSPSVSVTSLFAEHEPLFLMIGKLAQYLREEMNLQPAEYRSFLNNIIKKMMSASDRSLSNANSFSSKLEIFEPDNTGGNDFDFNIMLKPLEVQFLKAIKELLPYVTEDMPFELVKAAIDEVLEKYMNQSDNDAEESNSLISKLLSSHLALQTHMEIYNEDDPEGGEEEEHISTRKSIIRNMKDAKPKEKNELRSGVPIPPFYKRERITGRGGVVYKTFGGVALRTQGYPNALQCPNFPSPILRPDETYKHTITYKFWVLAGNPAKWLRRLEVGPCVDVTDLSQRSSSTHCSSTE